MAEDNEGEGRNEPNIMPEEALKRFADNLTTNETGKRFLEQNLQRVDDFINKPPTVDIELDRRVVDDYAKEKNETDDTLQKRREKQEAFRKEYKRSRGFYDYDKKAEPNLLVNLQKHPEMSNALGTRSRFGEGDGGFMDRWLISPTSDPSVAPQPLNGGVIPPFRGYKRHINTFKHGPVKTAENFRTIKSYADRRAERLAREQKEREKKAGVQSQWAPQGRYIHDSLKHESTHIEEKDKRHVSSEKEDKTAPNKEAFLTLPRLTDVERDTYFGARARVAFFDFYNQLSKLRNITTSGSVEDLLYEGSMSGEENSDEDDRHGEGDRLKLPQVRNKREIIADADAEDGLTEDNDDTESNATRLSQGSDGSILEDGVSIATDPRLPLQGTSLVGPPDGFVGTYRPASARSRFIAQCVEHDIGPKPALMIRKGVTSELNLKSQNMGDKVAQKLAFSLEVMPYLQHFNISDNSLTDPGLSAIIKGLHHCKSLYSLDISRNKIDIEAARALGAYLETDHCHLHRLVLQNADIDDEECSKFVTAIAVKKTIQYVDMSRNLLGTQENKASFDSTFQTGGASIAELLRSATCPLETLILSWNSMRRSSIPIALSLRANRTVTKLDLSYNSLGNEGAEVLGNSLHYNATLVDLDLTNCKIMARGCFVLTNGAYWCTSLRHLRLAENPVGDIGLRSVMALQLHFTNEELDVNIKGCSFKMVDSSATFDPRHVASEYSLDLSKPYERAVAVALAREVASHDDVCFTDFSFNNIPMKFLTRRRGRESRVPKESQATTQSVPSPEKSAGEGEGEGALANNDEASESAKATQEGDGDKRSNILEPEPEPEPELDSEVNITSIANDLDHAESMFRRYDQDGSGGIDRQELALVLSNLGLDNNHDVIEELMEQYDSDCGGVIELSEFKEFLLAVQLSAARNQSYDNEERFLIDDLHGEQLEPKEWLVPDEGYIVCTVSTGQAIPEFVEAISPDKLQSLLDGAKAYSDSSALIEAAVSTTKLKAAEAKKVYRALLKDSGEVVHSLKKVLPHCLGSSDARAVVAYARPESVSEMCAIKMALGPLYRVCMGMPNGYYYLQLDNEEDRMCLDKLVEISASAKDLRSRTNQCDNSQNGDSSSFRNVTLDKKPGQINDEFLTHMPERGALSFDFVALHDYAFSKMDTVLSDRRLFKILGLLHVLDNAKEKELKDYTGFSEWIKKYDEKGRLGAKGMGMRAWTMGLDQCNKTYTLQDTLFDNLVHRHNLKVLRHQEVLEEVSSFEEECLTIKELSRPVTEGQPVQSIDESEDNSGENILGVYQKHINRLLRSEAAQLDPHILAYRTYEGLLETLSNRHLSCAQLALIVRLFPHKDISFAEKERLLELTEREAGNPELATALAEGSITEDGLTSEGAGGLLSVDMGEGGEGDSTLEMIKDAVKAGVEEGNTGGEFDLDQIEAAAQVKKQGRDAGVMEGEDGHDGDEKKEKGELVEEGEEQISQCPYSTIRVDLIINLFSALVDKMNFDSVLTFLTPAEIAILVFRLGPLNVFNTLKPEGFWTLDMSRRDERQLVKALTLLSFAEPGKNFQSGLWREPNKPVHKDWTVPLSWFSEASLPRSGKISFKFVSTSSEGDEGFKPDFAKRAVFSCISISQPYAQDARMVKKVTLDNAENIIEEMGVALTFRNPESV